MFLSPSEAQEVLTRGKRYRFRLGAEIENPESGSSQSARARLPLVFLCFCSARSVERKRLPGCYGRNQVGGSGPP